MQVRNEIVYNLMGDIDRVFGEYAIRLNAGKGAEAFGFDTLTLGLSGASTIATHAATKTILSALGTGLAGTGQSFDRNFFAQQTFAVLAIAMQTRRDKVRATIVANLTADVTVYPLSAAKRDLIAYYYAGTLAGGLQELQQESANATIQSRGVTATPAFSPADGGPYSTVTVVINDATPGASIYYTLDGSPPSTSSSLYTGPITITSTKTLKAIAVAAGFADSTVASQTYTIQPEAEAAPNPVISPQVRTTPLLTEH